MFFVYLVLGMICTYGGDYGFKAWADSGVALNFIIGFISYVLALFCWAGCIQSNNNLAIGGSIWCICSLSGSLIIGLVVFSDAVSQKQIVGLVLSVIAVILML